MAKKIVGFIKLQVPAGKANPSPPIGPALGQRGLNIMEFCKAFNAQTQGVEPGLPLPVVITAFADKSFTFVIKTPPATVLIKKAIKLDKGSDFVGGAALLAEKQGGAPNQVIFFKTGDRRIMRADTPVLGPDGTIVGRVLSGTLSPILNEAIGSAFVTTASAAGEGGWSVDIRGARLPLHRVRPPFVLLKK